MDNQSVGAACEDVVAFLLASGVYEHEATQMRELKEQNEHRELLELAERYGNCMAFLDHMELTNKLSIGWSAVCDKFNHDKKQVVRKLRVMEADKNADPDMVENYRAKRDKLQKDLALINLTCMRMEKLKEIPVDYDMQFPDEMLLPEAARAMLVEENEPVEEAEAESQPQQQAEVVAEGQESNTAVAEQAESAAISAAENHDTKQPDDDPIE